ncbi:MAG TPA: ribonuclease HII [Chloroflexota bacterium]|nr:ribonuclease HII [Chloroflexota bacterium]
MCTSTQRVDLAAPVGLDEVGRGALAGPLVAAAVALPAATLPPPGVWLRDSKQLSPEQRDRTEAWIRAHASLVLIEVIGVDAINGLGIGWANRMIFARLMARLGPRRYLVDGNLRLHGLGPAGARVVCRCQGDAHEPAIAAASIVAKVFRDRLMRDLDPAYPQYGWRGNAGYATPVHQRALKADGPCLHHRTLFLRRLLEATPP